MNEYIVIEDFDLARVIREQLEKNAKRDNRLKTMIDNFTFTKEELESITKLSLKNGHFKDISGLKYLTNLVDLQIESTNAKNVSPKLRGGLEGHYRYDNAKIQTMDFSVINTLTKLKYLSIYYVEELKKLDISDLKDLRILELEGNTNLTEIVGLDDRKNLETLTLLKNGISKSFDLEKLLNSSLTTINLDFDLYPILKSSNPNIEQFKVDGFYPLTWFENISDIRYNKLSTYLMKSMDDKVREVLDEIISDSYTDIEKICAIYAYITQNIKYDHNVRNAKVSEDAMKQIQNEIKGRNMTSDTAIDRGQSSFNAIMYGKSVCEGYTNLMHYMLKSVGIQSVACACNTIPNKDFVGLDTNHAVLRAKIGDDWYYFDPTWDANKKNLENFFKSKNTFSINHSLSVTESNIKQPSFIPFTNDDLNHALSKVIRDKRNGTNKIINQNKRKTSSSKQEYGELYEEKLPFGSKKEEQKKSSFSKFKPIEQKKYTEQKKASNGKKIVESIINSNNSTQFVEYEEKDNQEMEEDQGMSL